MTINELASALAKTEGKNHQASIGDIREILKLLVLMEMDPDGPSPSLILNVEAVNKVLKRMYRKHRGGGSSAKRREAKVSKEDKVKGRGDGKAKRTGRGSRREDETARKPRRSKV